MERSKRQIGISVALATIGLLVFVIPHLIPEQIYFDAALRGALLNPPEFPTLLWIAGVASIIGAGLLGAGVGYFFGRKWTGLICGVLILFAVRIVRLLLFGPIVM